MTLIYAALLVALLAAAFAVRWWTWRPLVSKRVIVQADDGTSFEGMAMSRRGPLLVLVDVTVRIPGGGQRIDGTVVLERSRILFVQVV